MKFLTSSLFFILFILCAFLIATSVATKPEDEAWLKENALRDDVIVDSSGLQYRIIESGPADGAQPGPRDRVECHYRGTLTDGTEFDSSYSRGQPTTFGVYQVIKGWTIALQKMHVGDKWELFIPSELAYGESQRGRYITPGAALVFEIELI
eukprot:CAMPEP_0201551738 /NCGR_PEP_ID=MMETSP0173_2-20130828/9196_1 /ASSEMBLY_ACC=CAM_ASM_000268 /TAXON_ID=218659 /ORGANISM="Vexillifera sp., Strain DIVA3 564/2" /LENGTH=151 /DNA_ID=CAMNT_0047962067 /DNA_START=11 /DNA_END=463 /DNA_ORIENTATION=+